MPRLTLPSVRPGYDSGADLHPGDCFIKKVHPEEGKAVVCRGSEESPREWPSAAKYSMKVVFIRSTSEKTAPNPDTVAGAVHPSGNGECALGDVAVQRCEDAQRAEGLERRGIGWIDIRQIRRKRAIRGRCHRAPRDRSLSQTGPWGCERCPPGVLEHGERGHRRSAARRPASVPVDLPAAGRQGTGSVGVIRVPKGGTDNTVSRMEAGWPLRPKRRSRRWAWRPKRPAPREVPEESR